MTAAVLVFGLAAVVAPIGIAIAFAHRSALDGEQSVVQGYAEGALGRNDALTSSEAATLQRVAMNGKRFGPCSVDNLALMRTIVLTSVYFQGFGHVRGNVMDCSSFGARPFELGPVAVVGKLRREGPT